MIKIGYKARYIFALLMTMLFFEVLNTKNECEMNNYLTSNRWNDSNHVCSDSSNIGITPKEINLNDLIKENNADTTITPKEVIQGEPPQGKDTIDSLKNLTLPVNRDSIAVQTKEKK